MKVLRCVAIVLAVLSAVSTVGAADELRAGVSVVDITPPVPFRLHGYFYERLSTGTKDPLHAKAIVFGQGKESAAFVFCDLVGVPLDVADAARKKASQATGIPTDHISVSGTHTHTGPQIFMALHDLFHERAVAKDGVDKHDSAPYRLALTDKIALAVVQAKAALAPAELKSGFAREERISFNRRFHMKDGSVVFNPKEMNPNIVRPAGPIDPQVGIITIAKPGAKQPSSAIVSFAMHPDTTGGTLYSADYPYAVEVRLRKSFGQDFTLLYGTGTCGDINHRDVHHPPPQRRADELGEMLGDTVANAIQKDELTAIQKPELAVRSVKVPAPLQSISAADLAKATAKIDRIGTRGFPFYEAVEACKILDVERLRKLYGNTLQLEVQAFRLDRETAIVTLPSEIFVNLGLAIKAASPFKTTLVVELANNSVAYIPTKQAFEEGSYEVINSRVVRGTGEKLVDAAVTLLKELQ